MAAKPPIRGLQGAPFAILWEATRIAQHCGDHSAIVNNLKYSPDSGWHLQPKLRAALASCKPLLGKSLPAASDADAWTAALNTFERAGKAVVLSADLVPCLDGSGQPFEVRLKPLKLELSHRLDRRFGADRFLEINVPLPSESKQAREVISQDSDNRDVFIRWLTQSRHYFLGRIWQAFYCREAEKSLRRVQTSSQTRGLFQDSLLPPQSQFRSPVYLFACNGDEFRNMGIPGFLSPPEEALTPSQRTKMKRSVLLQWAIDIQENSRQMVAKLFTRIALSKK